MAIRDLEQYSQEFIAHKRLSRTSTVEEVSEKSAMTYENIWETRGMRSYGDTQRSSCTSGIYEEIPDAAQRRNAAPRASIASGIYEEMLPVSDEGAKKDDQMPPPLPPRTRINTYENEIHRSFTNPESENLKKKRYRAMLDSVLGLGRRTPKDKKGKKAQSPASLTTKFLSLDITQGQRNSFSSPNLTKITRSVSESDAMEQFQCGASLSDDFWCHETYLNTVSSQPETKVPFDDGEEGKTSQRSSMENLLEVSETSSVAHLRQNSVDCRIGSSQEEEGEPQEKDGSVNGAFNGIYFKFQDERKPEKSPAGVNPEGYLEMGPIGFNRAKVRELDELEQKKPDLSGYVEMNGNGFSQEAVEELDRLEADRDIVSNVTFSRGCDSPADPSRTMSPQEKRELQQEVLRDLETPPKRVNAFDEKIPSYFPNEIVRRNSSSRSLVREGKRRYQKSPEVMRQAKSLNGDVQLAKRKPIARLSEDSADVRQNSQDNSAESRLNVQSLTEKCATLSRLSRCSLRADISSGLRRFASLPRFRKLDLTPLKTKISSVLQR